MNELEQSISHNIFLLTCWAEKKEQDEQVNWRYRLERPYTGQHFVCSDLDQLVDYLKEFQNEK